MNWLYSILQNNISENSPFSSSGEFDSAYFPQKLLPQIRKFSRVNKSNLLQRSMSTLDDDVKSEHLPQSWSPSSIRKMNAQIKSLKSNIELCYLGEKQYFGLKKKHNKLQNGVFHVNFYR